jgi:iron complex transport system substrate-binding protein
MGVLVSMALLAGFLAGCAEPANNNTGTPESTPAETETSAPQISGNGEAAFPFTYTDARGKEITIEKKPERIAVTTWMITEKLLALDTPPVAADTIETMSAWASMKGYLEKYRIEDLGTEVNIEKLLEARPDLILATAANENIYDQLEAISPVIVFDVELMFGDWQTSLQEVAKVVSEEDAAEAFINTLMERIVQARDNLSADGKTVGFLRLWSKTVYSMGISACAAYYDRDNGLGLGIPEGWPEEIGELSLEALTETDPDYIFVSSIEDEAYMEELGGNSVWNSLTAVREGHVYTIDLSALSGGALAAQYGVSVVYDALSR